MQYIWIWKQAFTDEERLRLLWHSVQYRSRRQSRYSSDRSETGSEREPDSGYDLLFVSLNMTQLTVGPPPEFPRLKGSAVTAEMCCVENITPHRKNNALIG